MAERRHSVEYETPGVWREHVTQRLVVSLLGAERKSKDGYGIVTGLSYNDAAIFMHSLRLHHPGVGLNVVRSFRYNSKVAVGTGSNLVASVVSASRRSRGAWSNG